MKAFAACAALLAALSSESVHPGPLDLPAQVGGPFSVPVVSLKEGRFRATVPQQYDFSCGSAALSTLLTHHYGQAVTEQAVFEEMFRQGDQRKIQQEGFSLLDMKRYLETHGFEADGFEVPLDKLASARIPAITLINENGYNHFVVIKGLREQRVLIGDPAGGTRAMSREAFEAMWATRIVFVVTNRQEFARFNQASDWRVTPSAPLSEGIVRQGLGNIVMPKLGPTDF